MPYKTNAVIKVELDALGVGYDDDMTNEVLQELLDGATETPEDKKPKGPQVQAEEVPLGVGTINNHEQRICELEQCVIKLNECMVALKELIEAK